MIQRTSIHCAITADGRSQLNRPSGLAFDPRNLYISDPAAGAIWKALPSPVAANETPTPSWLCGGPCNSAFFRDPFRPLPSCPGDFHPEALTDSGREPPVSSGSCRRLKAAAFRLDLSVPPVAG